MGQRPFIDKAAGRDVQLQPQEDEAGGIVKSKASLRGGEETFKRFLLQNSGWGLAVPCLSGMCEPGFNFQHQTQNTQKQQTKPSSQNKHKQNKNHTPLKFLIFFNIAILTLGVFLLRLSRRCLPWYNLYRNY